MTATASISNHFPACVEAKLARDVQGLVNHHSLIIRPYSGRGLFGVDNGSAQGV